MTDAKEPDGFDGRLELLSMAQRAVFLLRELDGLDYDAIGYRLGLSRAMVAAHLTRAIQLARFGPEEDETAELARIERRLALLPRTTRAVFLLNRTDGLAYEQIAWRLRLDTERVKRHFARAIYTITWGPPRRWWNPWRRDDDDPS